MPDDGVMIFKSNSLLMDDDLEHIRNDIKKQMGNSIIALNNAIDFIGYLKATDKGVFIFKDNGLLINDDYEYLREKIKQQIDEGLVILNGNVDFVGCIGKND